VLPEEDRARVTAFILADDEARREYAALRPVSGSQRSMPRATVSTTPADANSPLLFARKSSWPSSSWRR